MPSSIKVSFLFLHVGKLSTFCCWTDTITIQKLYQTSLFCCFAFRKSRLKIFSSTGRIYTIKARNLQECIKCVCQEKIELAWFLQTFASPFCVRGLIKFLRTNVKRKRKKWIRKVHIAGKILPLPKLTWMPPHLGTQVCLMTKCGSHQLTI